MVRNGLQRLATVLNKFPKFVTVCHGVALLARFRRDLRTIPILCVSVSADGRFVCCVVRSAHLFASEVTHLWFDVCQSVNLNACPGPSLRENTDRLAVTDGLLESADLRRYKILKTGNGHLEPIHCILAFKARRGHLQLCATFSDGTANVTCRIRCR